MLPYVTYKCCMMCRLHPTAVRLNRDSQDDACMHTVIKTESPCFHMCGAAGSKMPKQQTARFIMKH